MLKADKFTFGLITSEAKFYAAILLSRKLKPISNDFPLPPFNLACLSNRQSIQWNSKKNNIDFECVAAPHQYENVNRECCHMSD